MTKCATPHVLRSGLCPVFVHRSGLLLEPSRTEAAEAQATAVGFADCKFSSMTVGLRFDPDSKSDSYYQCLIILSKLMIYAPVGPV
jgi:hypothetical protein